MKKLLIASCLMLGFSVLASAQTAAAARPTETKTKTVKAEPAKAAASTAKVTDASGATTHKKADGTLDKRYKENKSEAKPAGPTKADGTPDKRYKANKPAAKAKS